MRGGLGYFVELVREVERFSRQFGCEELSDLTGIAHGGRMDEKRELAVKKRELESGLKLEGVKRS